jgi:DNA-binding NtrC family response regulator
MLSERLLWIGEDPASQKLFELAQGVAPVATPVLISGERGTGKNYLARLIHEFGPRRDAPFLTIHCSALPNGLVEAELFGYERGGFAGATERKLGAFELALQGTVVLDEIASLNATAQERLLRALQERSLTRLGGTKPFSVESRVIALTNADMPAAVKDGRFRAELYQRLDMARIWVPPLRERPVDILPLAEFFLESLGRKHGKPGMHLGERAKTVLQVYRWPGNVQELQAVLERAVTSGQAVTIEATDLPTELQAAGQQNGDGHLRGLEEVEREAILATLEATDYQIGRSAQILGISRKTLLEKRKKFGMR